MGFDFMDANFMDEAPPTIGGGDIVPGDEQVDDSGLDVDAGSDSEFPSEDGFLAGPDPNQIDISDFGEANSRPNEGIFYNPQTGDIVDGNGSVILAEDQVRRLSERIQELNVIQQKSPNDTAAMTGVMKAIDKELEPLNKFLGTPTGRTLAFLGLGSAGILAARMLDNDNSKFKPPTRSGIADNPASRAAALRIRQQNLGRLEKTPVGGTEDPLTARLTERALAAARGDTSNPVLERAIPQEQAELANRLNRLYGPNWELNPTASKQAQNLGESQSIRRYLDNMDTLARLEPRQFSRVNSEADRAARLAGLDEIGAADQARQDLETTLAYNDFVRRRNRSSELARSVAGIFGSAAGYGLTGGVPWRNPWMSV